MTLTTSMSKYSLVFDSTRPEGLSICPFSLEKKNRKNLILYVENGSWYFYFLKVPFCVSKKGEEEDISRKERPQISLILKNNSSLVYVLFSMPFLKPESTKKSLIKKYSRVMHSAVKRMQ